jgi:formylglycine-generating enzyme required for sulfatase activity
MNDATTGYGSVANTFRIGKHEFTNLQYVEFLNSANPTGANVLDLFDPNMASCAVGGINFNGGAANGSKFEVKPGRDNNPVVFVSWYDAIRVANWFHNNQGSGDTESGAYTLLGGTPTPSNGNSITRNPGARWWLSSEDEWYKAAYHKNDGASGNYWDYPMSTDAEPFSDQPPGSDAPTPPTPSRTGNFVKNDGAANGFDDGFGVTGSPTFVNSQNYLTDVGAYTLSVSPYGTFDQGGNVFEWNESLINSVFRGRRGGLWSNLSSLLAASHRNFDNPFAGSDGIGFRLATIPEPGTMLLAIFGVLGWQPWRRRRQARCAPFQVHG